MRNSTLALLFLAASSACTAAGDPPGPRDGQSAVVARVDGEPVTLAGYRTWLADVYGQQAREEYLGLWLLEREARRRGVSVSEPEIAAGLETLWADWIKDRLKGDREALDGELQRQGHTRESYRRWFHWQKRRELLAARLIHLDRSVDSEWLQRRFEQQYGPKGVRTRVRLLVLTRARMSQEIAHEPNARVLTAEELDKRLIQKAEALRARVLAGENFQDVVRAESNDLAVRKDGGVCGDEEWRLRGAAFVQAVESAKLHELQPPVPNSSGVDLFEVLARDTTRFEDVHKQLEKEMLDAPPSLEEVTALDRRLREASRIEHP